MQRSIHHRGGASHLFLAVALASVAFLAGRGAEARSLDSLDPKLRTEVVDTGRKYFDEAVDKWVGRKEFRTVLDKVAAAGVDPLKDLGFLRELLYQARDFEDDLASKEWQKKNAITFVANPPYNNLLSDLTRFTYVVPPTYSTTTMKKPPLGMRLPPLPLLFVLHEKDDDKGSTTKTHAGEEALRRWWPKDAFPSIYDGWLMLAPSAPRAKFVEEDGTLRKEFTIEVFASFWKRYHVDFDRVVLDGADAALAMAAAQPVFFAGLIVRGGKFGPATVKNFASVPIYLVGDAATMKEALVAAGHPNVTEGPASGLPDWLGKLRRTPPKKFTWTMAKPDQLLAHWISIDTPDPGASEHTLAVEVDAEKNRVTVEAKGILELTTFLNDEILDLDKEVELVINGHSEKKEKLERKFDQTLDKEPIRIRRSMYLGWLFPSVLPKISVRAPESKAPDGEAGKPAPAAPSSVAPADPETEERAQKLWQKATEAEAASDIPEAKRLYGKVVELGNTTLKEKAETKLKELEAKPGGETPK